MKSMTISFLYMDRLDTLDTPLFCKNKIKNNFLVLIDFYCKYNTSTSKSIKNIFFKSDLKGVHSVHPVQYYEQSRSKRRFK